MNITNFQEKPYFESLPRYALPALQTAFDKALNPAFSSLAIYNGLCRDFAEVGIEKPKQHVFNDWIGIHKKTVSRPGGPAIAEGETPADTPAVEDADAPVADENIMMIQRRVTQSGQLRINGKYFKAEGVTPGTDVLVRPDPRDPNRYSMFGLKDGRYVGEAICDVAPAEPEAMPSTLGRCITAVEREPLPPGVVDVTAVEPQVDEAKPFFTPAFPAEETGTLVERMIAETKADLMRDIDARAKRLVADRLRLLADTIEGAHQ